MALSSDRNLLCAVLALQVGAVTRDQLIQAVDEFVAADSQTLGDFMVQRQLLDADQQQALEMLITAQLERHGEPRQSCAAILENSVSANVSLGGTDDPDSTWAQLLRAPSRRSVATSGATHVPSDVTSAGTVERSRFQKTSFHNEGGLGRIFIAQDTELNRTVALKEIKERYADDPQNRARFEMEAEVTARLEHPGIVPVYGRGQYRDGRPYYAMKLIQGDSLRKAINDFHETDWKRRSDGERMLQLRRLLQRFLDVCNAVSYAHRRGVLHRDLKPDNVLLGEFGETLVVDWGLAKPGRSHSQPSSPTATSDGMEPLSGSGIEPTVMGRAIGSPAFMSPEQARGEHDRIGPTTDVYGLGATLFMLLTNQRSIEGSDRLEVLDRVRVGLVRTPRSLVPDTPRPLEAICLKALALRPEDRYQTAGELISDIEQYLADAPVSAYHESVTERLARFGRRHRTALRYLMLLLICVTMLSAVAALALNHEKNQTLVQQRRTQNVLELLVGMFRLPDDEYDGRKITAVQLLERAAGEVEHRLPDDRLAQAQLNHAIGDTYLGLGLYNEAVPMFEKALDIRTEALGEVHSGTLKTLNGLADAHYSAGRVSSAKPIYERLYRFHSQNGEPQSAEAMEAMHSLGVAHLSSMNDVPAAVELLEGTLTRRQRHLGPAHPDTIATRISLAYAYELCQRDDAALTQIEQAIELSRESRGHDDPTTLSALHMQAIILMNEGRDAEAMSTFKEVYELRQQRLGHGHPHTLGAMNDYAALALQHDKQEEGLDLLRRCYELRRAKLGADNYFTIESLSSYAAAVKRSGDVSESIRLLLTAIDSAAGNPRYDGERLIRLQKRLAKMYKTQRQFGDAVNVYQQILDAQASAPGGTAAQLAKSRESLAYACYLAGAYERAINLYQMVIEHHQRAHGPDSTEVMTSRCRLGEAYLAADQLEKADDVWTHVLDSVHHSGGVPASFALSGRAVSLLALEDFRSAEETCRQWGTQCREDGDDHEAARAEACLGEALLRQGRQDDARGALESALTRIDPDQHDGVHAYIRCLLFELNAPSWRTDELRRAATQLRDQVASARRFTWPYFRHRLADAASRIAVVCRQLEMESEAHAWDGLSHDLRATNREPSGQPQQP